MINSQLKFNAEGNIILPKDTSTLVCKCDLKYKISTLCDRSFCYSCHQNLFEQLSEEDKEDIRAKEKRFIEQQKKKQILYEEFKKQIQDAYEKITDEQKQILKQNEINKKEAEIEFKNILTTIQKPFESHKQDLTNYSKLNNRFLKIISKDKFLNKTN